MYTISTKEKKKNFVYNNYQRKNLNSMIFVYNNYFLNKIV